MIEDGESFSEIQESIQDLLDDIEFTLHKIGCTGIEDDDFKDAVKSDKYNISTFFEYDVNTRLWSLKEGCLK